MTQVDLLLPLKGDLGDFAARMGDLVVALATIEQRPVWEILNDLSGPSGDVFRLRVAGSVAALGNLPLDEAIKLLEGGRQLLWSSAFSIIRPETLHPQRTIKQVEDFLKSCRLGQTERGSFVATILAPVPPEIQPSLANLDAGRVSNGTAAVPPAGDDPTDVEPGSGLECHPNRQGRSAPGCGPSGHQRELMRCPGS